MNTISIKKNNDPFKKYWWVILLAFGGVGGWICMPLMDTPVGAGSVSTRGFQTADQSLDSRANPSGAPGYDLSMPDGYTKKGDLGGSSLYQAPPEATTGAAAAGAPLTDAAAASFAADMKALSKKTDTSGWGGAVPQKGFATPKVNSALTGLGSSGGGSGASAGGSGMGAFGSKVAQTGFASTQGLGSGSGGSAGGKPIMGAAKAAASMGQSALMSKSADVSRAMAGASFDGSKKGTAIGDGQAQGLGGSYSGLDAAPANLKVNDPDSNVNSQETIPAEYAAETDENEEMRKAIMMMVVSAVVTGVVGGVCGSVFGTAAGAATNPVLEQWTKSQDEKYQMKTKSE